jgi:site-specific recombinase XerC
LRKKWGTEAKVPNCLPHRFRHSFGTEPLVKTRDLRLVHEAMGHEDIGSTAIYILGDPYQGHVGASAGRHRAARLGL